MSTITLYSKENTNAIKANLETVYTYDTNDTQTK